MPTYSRDLRTASPFRRAAWTALFLLGAPLAARAGDELVLKEANHKEIGTALRNLVEAEAKDAKAGAKARAAIVDVFAKTGKAAKKLADPAAATQAVLAMTADLGKAIYFFDERKMAGIKPGEIAAGVIDVEGDQPSKIGYAVWTPKTYRPNGETVPVVLCMPGMKDGKPYSAKQFLVENWVDAPIREKTVLVAIDMPADGAVWNTLFDDEGKEGGIALVMRVFGRITSTYNVDYDRIFLVGVETGLPVALRIAGMYPQRFAGVVGQRGDAGDASWENFRSVPTWFAGGGANCTAFAEKTKAAGFDNCTIQQDGNDAAAWAWIAERKRIANPTKVNLVLGAPAPFQAYWLMTEPQELEPGTRIDAEVDRAANTLTITAKGVKRVTVYFNDVLLDLDKPIKVVCNGVEREDKIARSLEDFISYVRRRTCDGGRVYVASKVYDLPPPKD
ncbi:MAG: hypothetical protein K8S98_12390 [Planctomycetes bacterium]|nr:hypothetical protein [Planctomycetota bacterium]